MASRAPVANFPVFVDRFARKTGCVRFCRTSSLEQPLTLFDTTNRPGSVSGVEPFLPLIASVDKGVRSRANVSKKKTTTTTKLRPRTAVAHCLSGNNTSVSIALNSHVAVDAVYGRNATVQLTSRYSS